MTSDPGARGVERWSRNGDSYVCESAMGNSLMTRKERNRGAPMANALIDSRPRRKPDVACPTFWAGQPRAGLKNTRGGVCGCSCGAGSVWRRAAQPITPGQSQNIFLIRRRADGHVFLPPLRTLIPPLLHKPDPPRTATVAQEKRRKKALLYLCGFARRTSKYVGQTYYPRA